MVQEKIWVRIAALLMFQVFVILFDIGINSAIILFGENLFSSRTPLKKENRAMINNVSDLVTFKRGTQI